MMRPQLLLSTGQVAALLAEAHHGLPDEICGILGGLKPRVEQIFSIQNISQHPHDSFYMEPVGLFHALEAIEDRGWDILAAYHSHPSGARTDPSPVDRIRASYPGSLLVIVVPDRDGFAGIIRAFDMTSSGFPVEVPVVVGEISGPSSTPKQPLRGFYYQPVKGVDEQA